MQPIMIKILAGCAILGLLLWNAVEWHKRGEDLRSIKPVWEETNDSNS